MVNNGGRKNEGIRQDNEKKEEEDGNLNENVQFKTSKGASSCHV